MHKSIVHSWHLLCMVGCLMVALSYPVCTFAQTGGGKIIGLLQGENTFVYS